MLLRPSRPVVPVVVLLTVLATGCSGDETSTPTAASRPASPVPAPSAPALSSGATVEPSAPPADASPTSGATMSGTTGSGATGSGTTASTAEPTGGPLSVTAVRVARQDGFDRVVLELAGAADGVPGWRVGYEDDPRRQGSGDPVDPAGDAVLVIQVLGAGYPFDTGQSEASSVTVPGDTEVVADVLLGSVFEGTYEAFVGVREQAPFRVTRLASPTRVVVDIEHP